MNKHVARAALAVTIAGSALSSTDAQAFTHVVSSGESLAQIALRVYGTPRFETAIVGANALDVRGGSGIVPGLPLQIPAPFHVRIETDATWADLARVHLGDPRRAEVLARANGAVSWVPPVVGQEIVVPAVIAHLAVEGDTIPGISQRYLADPNRAWELDAYNHRAGGTKPAPGEVVLVPLLEINLTADGKREAREAADLVRSQGGGRAHEAQRKAEAEIPPVLADVRGGRYVDAVSKANRLLGSGDLTPPQLASLHRALVESYVALDAPGLAAGACAAWREAAGGDLALDPRLISPKIRNACVKR